MRSMRSTRRPRSMPVARLHAADVIAGGSTGMSQATLYRAADSGRCYSVTPGARSNGKKFPAWQFAPRCRN